MATAVNWDWTSHGVGLRDGELAFLSEVVGLPIVYGTRKITGTTVYFEQRMSGTNSDGYIYSGGDWQQSVALGEGQVSDIIGVWLDDEYNALPEDQVRNRTYLYGANQDWDITLLNFTGSDSQLANNLAYDAQAFTYGNGNPASPNTSWSVNHKLSGVAHVDILWVKVYGRPTSVTFPKLTFKVSGLISGSTNPALILKDYLTNTRYGCSVPSAEIDTTSFTTAEGVCNQTNSGVKRHECNVALNPDQSLIENIKIILSSMNGQLHWVAGKYKLKIDDVYTGANVFDFEEKHIIGGIKIIGETKSSRSNQVKAKFINPTTFKEDEVSWPDSNNADGNYSAFLTADNSVPLKKEISLSAVSNWHQARFLAQQSCLLSRNSLGFAFTATSEALDVIVGDIVSVTHSTAGWSAKKFIVRSVTINSNGTVALSGIEYQASTYTWNSATAPADIADTNLPDNSAVLIPSGLTVAGALYFGVSSDVMRIRADLSWTNNSLYNSQFEYSFKLSSSSTWLTKYGTESTSGTVDDLTNSTYDFRVRAVGLGGRVSAWLYSNNVDISASITPAVASSLTVTEELYVNIRSAGANVKAILEWTSPPDYVVGGITYSDSYFYEVAYQVVGDTNWVAIKTSEVRHEFLNFKPAVFNFRVRVGNQMNNFSAWITESNVTIVGLTAPPATVEDFSMVAMNDVAYLSWSPTIDIDVRLGGHMRIRHSKNLSTTWSDAIDIGTRIAGSSGQAILPLLAGTYLAKWVDSEGNESLNSVSVQSSVPQIQRMNVAVTDIDHTPAFAGTMVNLVKTSDDSGAFSLQFDSTSDIDSFTGLVDSWTKIDAQGGLYTTGSYTTETFDLGQVYTSRITSHLDLTTYLAGDFAYIDSWGNIDSRLDFDEPANTLNLETWIRSTNDDPASSPTWTDWQRFQVSDYSGRGFQWQMRADSVDGDEQFNLTDFSISVDMPDKTLAEYSKATATISFPESFFAIPAVGITANNMATGDYFTLSSVTKTGFAINFYDSSASAVTRNYNYIAKGY